MYVDDCFSDAPKGADTSDFLITKASAALLGLPLAPEKESGPAQSVLLLGEEITISDPKVTVELAPRKRSKYGGLAKSALHSGRLAPASAAKLRGALNFAQSMCFGRYGRGVM